MTISEINFYLVPLKSCSVLAQNTLPNLANTLYDLTYQENTLTDNTNYLNRLDSYGCAAKSNDFYLFEGAWLSPALQAKVPNKSSDNKYWFWCTNALQGYKFWRDSIIVVKYKLPPLPSGGLYEDIKISDKENYDMRFTSIATSDTFGLQPTIDSLSDVKIRNHYEEFYKQSMKSPSYPVDSTSTSNIFNGESWDGVATIVIAQNKSIIEDCQLVKYGILPSSQFTNEKDTETLHPKADDEHIEDRLPYLFLPWENEFIDFPKLPTIIIRQMEARGETTAGAFSAFCNGGKECGDVNLAKSILKEYMPTLDVYHCENSINTLEKTEDNKKSDVLSQFSDQLENYFDRSIGGSIESDTISQGENPSTIEKPNSKGKQNVLVPVKIDHN